MLVRYLKNNTVEERIIDNDLSLIEDIIEVSGCILLQTDINLSELEILGYTLEEFILDSKRSYVVSYNSMQFCTIFEFVEKVRRNL